MQSAFSDGVIPCEEAQDYFARNEIHPISDKLPSTAESDRTYVPKHVIEEYLNYENRLELIFLCPCTKCTKAGGPVNVPKGPDRRTHWSDKRKSELQGNFMLIFALLIYIREAGLIQLFQRHELMLNGTSYLHRSHLLEVLQPEELPDNDVEYLIRRVLRKQYSFLVRVLEPSSDFTVINAKELLPIVEVFDPKREGAFARVPSFRFQSDEYRSSKFGDVRY
jgi:hypothetical protein